MTITLSRLGEVARGIDRSSWVSWSCFLVGFETASLSPSARSHLDDPANLAVILAAILFFFLAILKIQAYMRFSLLAKSYGEPNRLVTTGVFRWTRNPIYVAFLLPLASLSVYSFAASAVAIVLYLVLMTRFVISREEDMLERSFPDAYAAYKAATPRWLF
ncbi:MAG: methyltransferase family protein [Hyphomicrobium sp.]